jgi:hypothetical protein
MPPQPTPRIGRRASHRLARQIAVINPISMAAPIHHHLSREARGDACRRLCTDAARGRRGMGSSNVFAAKNTLRSRRRQGDRGHGDHRTPMPSMPDEPDARGHVPDHEEAVGRANVAASCSRRRARRRGRAALW